CDQRKKIQTQILRLGYPALEANALQRSLAQDHSVKVGANYSGRAKPVKTRVPPRKNSPKEISQTASEPSLRRAGRMTLRQETLRTPLCKYLRRPSSCRRTSSGGISMVSFLPTISCG